MQLRKTLGDQARQPRYIETIPKRGYRFIVDVEVVASDIESIHVSQEERDREGRSAVITEGRVELDSQDPNVLYNAACAFCMSGQLGEAMSCLEKSLPFCADRKWLDYDSYLDPLRSLPRFQELLRLPQISAPSVDAAIMQ